MVVTHEGGLKFAAQIGRHRLIVDQPEYTGGEDAGPAPIQLLGASLGTCVALYVQQFCQARNLPCEGMRVELLQHGAQHPNRIGQFSVRVVLPEALPPQYAEMLERVARSCPAHNTLAHGAGIELEIAVEAEASV
jgi:uncharacterized OsmC-like protein